MGTMWLPGLRKLPRWRRTAQLHRSRSRRTRLRGSGPSSKMPRVPAPAIRRSIVLLCLLIHRCPRTTSKAWRIVASFQLPALCINQVRLRIVTEVEAHKLHRGLWIVRSRLYAFILFSCIKYLRLLATLTYITFIHTLYPIVTSKRYFPLTHFF